MSTRDDPERLGAGAFFACALAAAALVALSACGPTPPAPPDAGNVFGGIDGSPSTGDPDADPDADPSAIDASVDSPPDAAIACGSDPEPDTEDEALYWGEMDDCDNDNNAAITGTLDGADDVDVFRVGYIDEPFCIIDNVAEVNRPADLCIYVECPDHETEVDCQRGTPATSPEGRPGCCGRLLEFDHDCNGAGFGGHDADYYVFVFGAPEGQCVSYTVDIKG